MRSSVQPLTDSVQPLRGVGRRKAPAVTVWMAKLAQPGQVFMQAINDAGAVAKRLNLGLTFHRHFKEMPGFSVRLPQLAAKVRRFVFGRLGARFRPLQFGLVLHFFSALEAGKAQGFPGFVSTTLEGGAALRAKRRGHSGSPNCTPPPGRQPAGTE